jgi:thioredoxin reductase
VDDVLIVGAGPAGLAAALQLRRYGLVPRLFEQSRPGGLLWNANLVENYLGFPNGIPGPQLVQAFVKQLGEDCLTRELVTGLSWEGGIFSAKTPTKIYQAPTAIIASGTKPRVLESFTIPAELQAKVMYDVADLLELVGKRIVILGNGDAAFDYALNLARKNSVIILNRNEQVKCLPLLWDRALACQNIDYRPRTSVSRLDVNSQGGMIVECSSPSDQMALPADYLIGAIGREPNLDFLSASLITQRADLERLGILHFVGDVKNGIFRQTAIAVGDGIRAGMHIYKVLKENAHEGNCFHR